MMNVDERINTPKIKLSCATRWVDRHLLLEQLIALYDPLPTTLQKLQLKRDGTVKQQTLPTAS